MYQLIDSYCRNILSCTKTEAIKNYLKDDVKRLLFEMKLSYGYFFYGSDDYVLYHANEEETLIQSEIKRLLNYNYFTISSHNVLLGHYFRHLFQMVKMLENEKSLKESERYTYAKQLRAQLNDNEQLLLYYNSMSEIGSEWLEPHKNKTWGRKHKCPIERFKMIKNIPSNIEILGIKPQNVFDNDISIFNKYMALL